MEDKELVLTEEQLEKVTGGVIDKIDNMRCPHCGSTNIIPYHSPTKGTAYLCCDCYNSINIELKK